MIFISVGCSREFLVSVCVIDDIWNKLFCFNNEPESCKWVQCLLATLNVRTHRINGGQHTTNMDAFGGSFSDAFPEKKIFVSWFNIHWVFLFWVKLMDVSNCVFNSSPPSAAYMRQETGSALVQVMACRLFGTKPLSEPLLTYYYQLDP